MNKMRDVSICKVVNEVKKSLPEITEDNIMKFLMGEKNEYMDKVLRSKTKNQILPFDKGKREALANSKKWTEERFNSIFGCKESDGTYQKFVNVIKEFWEKHIGKKWYCENDSDFIRSLVSYIWLRTPCPEEAFVWTPINKEEYVSWEEKENELLEKLSKASLTFVTGNAANGKRKLVNHHLKMNKIANYVNAEVSSNSNGTVVSVEYILSGKQEVALNKFLKHCEWRREDDYIILTWSYFTADEMAPLLNWVKNHEVKVIVLTRMSKIPKGYKIVKIGKWPEKLMMKLSGNKLKEDASEEEQKVFFEMLHYNPFLVEVFSKYLNQSSETRYSFCENAKREGETEQLALSKGSKVHCSYRVSDTGNKGKDENALPIASSLVKGLLPCPNNDICTLCELIVWTRTPIDKEFVIKMGGFKEETIADLIDKGYLIYTEEKKIQMYPVFVWAIDALEVELCTINSDETSTQIKAKYGEEEILFDENGVRSGMNLLDSMKGNSKCPTTHIEYFYQVIENIICRYQRIYSANTNITDKRKTKYYEQWTEFLEKVIVRLQEMSPSKQAMRVLGKIYIIYKKEKPENMEKIDQTLGKAWAEFVYDVMNGRYNNKTIYGICSGLHSCVDIRMFYPILDICILREIAELSLEFVKPVKERIIWFKNPYLQYLLKKYFDNRVLAKRIKRYDDRSDMYTTYYYYYLFAIHRGRSLIQKARESVSATYHTTRYATSDEEWMRAQLYFLFFELLIDTETCDFEFLKTKYKYLMQDISERLQTRSYSATTTSTAIIVLMIARAWVPVEMMEGKIDELLLQFKAGEYDLFQKLAEVNKYQYQLDDEKYQKLLEVIKRSTEGIYKVLKESFSFKENE